MYCTITVPPAADAAISQPAAITCPPFCSQHLEGVEPGRALHVSALAEVAGVVVSAERFDTEKGAGDQVVSIQSLDQRVTATEARRLAALLNLFAKVTEGESGSSLPATTQQRLAALVPDCTPWCIVELPGDTEDQTLHVGNDKHVHTNSFDGERGDVAVSLEGYIGQVPNVRVQGAGDTPMTPGDALALAQLLVAAAREAYGLPR
ncbi:hypothetical protein [Actinoplanes sp. NPDC026670]|uniref:hypothetical protein n=1 Tax=Actinoplanes sp. NPDC026670 TaxID=3154700 RepID=UPI00340FBB7F